MKKILKVLLILILVVVVLAGAGVGYLSLKEYKPEAVEDIPIAFPLDRQLQEGQDLDILSWNIGYAALGAEADFFMDGGSGVRGADEATVERYLAGIRDYIYSDTPDLIMLQEVDLDSDRSYGIDEAEYLVSREDYVQRRTFAKNYSVAYIPYPLPPLSKVEAGLYTISHYSVESAERVALPCPFSWPVRAVNLKRCLLVNYLPIEGSDKQLVLVNLHLEAYDSGEGKIAQTKQLTEFIQSEYEKGNYVIAGGDFNQVFPGALEAYPNNHPELWSVGALEENLPEGFTYACDLTTPSCRLLNQPYDPSDTTGTQYYVIDGFILSSNVTLQSVETVDLGFENSDHNPVRLQVTLN